MTEELLKEILQKLKDIEFILMGNFNKSLTHSPHQNIKYSPYTVKTWPKNIILECRSERRMSKPHHKPPNTLYWYWTLRDSVGLEIKLDKPWRWFLTKQECDNDFEEYRKKHLEGISITPSTYEHEEQNKS